MDKKQLIEAYNGYEALKKLGVENLDSALDKIEELENEYLQKIVIPELEEKFAELLSGLPRAYDLFGRYQGEGDCYVEVEKSTYSFDDVEEAEETPSVQPTKCCGKNTINNFILDVFDYFDRIHVLDRFSPYIVPKSGLPLCSLIKSGILPLHALFLECSVTEMERRNANTMRWFSRSFMIGSHRVFVSTQWRNDHKDTGLQLSIFEKYVQSIIGKNYSIKRIGKEYCLLKG